MAYVNKEKTGFFGRLFHSRRNNNPQSSEAEQTVVQLAAMPVLAEQIVTEDQTASTSAQPKNLKQIVPVSSNAARTWDELLEKILKDQSTAFGSQDVHSNTTGEAVEDYAEPDAPTTQFAPLDEIPADPGSQDYTPYADLGTAQDADLGTAPDNDLSAAQEAFAAGDYEAALSGFEAAYLAGSETAQTGLLKALVALGDSTEKAEKALEYYERALSLAGPNQVLVSKLIQQCVNAGRFTDAKVYLEQAFMPESTEYQAGMQRIHSAEALYWEKQGQLEYAWNVWREALTEGADASLYQAALKTLNLYLDRLIAADKVNEALGVLATAKKLGLPATLPQAELIRLSLTTGSELVLPRLNLERPHTYCPVRLTER